MLAGGPTTAVEEATKSIAEMAVAANKQLHGEVREAVREAHFQNFETNLMINKIEKERKNFKEMMEAQRKKLQDSLEALQSLQEQGGDQLLAKAAAVQDEVASYKEKLAVKKEAIRAHVNHALLNLLPFKPADK